MKKEESIPAHIFNRRLGSLESIVKYLREDLGLRYCEISLLTDRNQKTVWNIYRNAVSKFPDEFKKEKSAINFPLSILKNKKLSVMENITLFLRNQENLSFSEIGMLLKRDIRTVWTAHSRAVRKS